jgi:F0F1-type ATP synthase gamma subunit
MAQKKLILEELEALNSIKDLAQSYEEIAVIRMQKIKDSVLKTREFLSDISDVFVDLKSSYEREVKDLMEKVRKGDKHVLSILQKSNKTLLVYLSSNGRLYGSVTQKTHKLFIEDLKKTTEADSDIAIIGKAGKEMYEGSHIGRPFEYFEIPDTSVDIEHVKGLMKKFLQYEKVYVYYGNSATLSARLLSRQASPVKISLRPKFHHTSHEKTALSLNQSLKRSSTFLKRKSWPTSSARPSWKTSFQDMLPV